MSDMKSLVDQFPGQLKEAIGIGEKFSMTKPAKEIRNILITGLGGSGIGGTIVAEIVFNECKVPITVNKDYFVPAFVNDEPCFARSLPVQGSGVGYGSLSWNLMSNRCATSITDQIPSRWQAVNSSTDNTVWASFIAPTSGRVKIRAENIGQIKGDADWHDDINLQLAVYATDQTCFDKYGFYEIITDNESGFDGALDEANPASDEYVSVCVCGVFPTCGYDEYYTVKCLIPGKEYFIMIDGDAGYTCNEIFFSRN